jgi:hypothetical protein
VLDRNGIPVRGQITRVLPAVTAFQTVPTAAKLDLDVSKSTMVANAVPLSARSQEARSAPCATTLASPGPRQTRKHLTDQ